MLEHKITTFLIEKTQENLDALVTLISDFKEINIIGTSLTGNQAISLIHNYTPQLVILNTDISDINGLDIVRRLQNRNIYPEIIFIGNNENLAFETLSFKPLDFWIRPVSKDMINNSIGFLKVKLKKQELFRKMEIFVQSQEVDLKRIFQQKKGIIILYLDEIIYCKSDLSSTQIELKTGEIVTVKTGLKQTLEVINNMNFVKTSRSYCINRQFLRKIDKRNYKCILYFEGKTWEVPTSKNSLTQLEKLNVFPIN